jgi:hypothetical protein
VSNETNPEITKFFDRVKELRADGLEFTHASGIAQLEQGIERWPKGWGDDFEFLLYGDFEPLQDELTIDRLGIAVFPENRKDTVIKRCRTIHRAKINVSEKTIDAVLDASRRINIFLGVFTLVTWTNCYCGWWSYITHGSGGGVLTKLNHKDLVRAVDGAVSIRPDISEKVEAALFWVRESKQSMMDVSSSELLKAFAAYWNAFECLVDAVCLAVPREKQSKPEKHKKLEEIFKEHGEELTTSYIQEAYTTVVNPGLKGKAVHALEVCFGEAAKHFVHECFGRNDRASRLYDIRNSINHGNVKAENPQELARIESRLTELSIMILGMFGKFIPYPYPLHRDSSNAERVD